MMDISIDQVFEVDYPFYLGEYTRYYAGEVEMGETWVPGCKSEIIYPDDCGFVAEGMGKMLLTLVDIHKPGRFPERVFYTRKWIDPDGDTFGSSRLHITTTPTFKRRAAGYYHEYRIK